MFLALCVCLARAGGLRDDSSDSVEVREREREAKRENARAQFAQAPTSTVDGLLYEDQHDVDDEMVTWRVDGSGERWVRVVSTQLPSSTSSAPETTTSSSSTSFLGLGLPYPSPLPPPPAPRESAHAHARARACATRELTGAEVEERETERARKRRLLSSRLGSSRLLRATETETETDFDFARTADDEVFHVNIPVVFHVIHEGDAGRVAAWRLRAQIDVLNKAFEGDTKTHDGASNGNAADAGVTFALHAAVYSDARSPGNEGNVKPSWFRQDCSPGTPGERDIRESLAHDPKTFLNVYVCEPPDGELGWVASFPDEFPEGDAAHGVFLLHSTIPGGDAAPYHLGDTAVHEVGHYLGLYHTFQGGCHDVWDINAGDAVYDTSPHAGPNHGTCADLLTSTFGGPADTCVSPGHSDASSSPYFGKDPVTNFMNYAVDSCMSEFTPGQAARIRETVEQYKPSLCANMRRGVCRRESTDVAILSGPPVSVEPPALAPVPAESPSSLAPSQEQHTPCADTTRALFLLAIRADDFPTEIGWRLTVEQKLAPSDDGQRYLVDVPVESRTVAGVSFGDLTEPRGEWAYRRCLEPGRYRVTLEDSWGDGLCCDWGEGEWRLYVDGAEVDGGNGDYGAGVAVAFDVRVPIGATYAPPPTPMIPEAPPVPNPPRAPFPPPNPPRPPRGALGSFLFPQRDVLLGSISA